MATRGFVPRADNEGHAGTSAKRLAEAHIVDAYVSKVYFAANTYLTFNAGTNKFEKYINDVHFSSEGKTVSKTKGSRQLQSMVESFAKE